MESNIKISEIPGSIRNSYSAIFFSENIYFGLLLIAITFFDLVAGFSGLIAVITANIFAVYFGFDNLNIKKGFYGFNALLTGLGLGINFEFSLLLIILVFLSAMLSLFLTIALEGIFRKYGSPFLSLPFLFAIWIFLMAAGKIGMLVPTQRGPFSFGFHTLSSLDIIINNIKIFFDSVFTNDVTRYYLKSLSSIYFQYGIIAGFVVFIGLLFHSRIATFYSFVGYIATLGFLNYSGIYFSEADFYYLGFNYILLAIAIGCYFLIPSIYSLLWVLILVPLNVIITQGLFLVLGIWGLPLFSLPFNILVILFLYFLKLRYYKDEKFSEVYYFFPNPEKTLYNYLTNTERFRNKTLIDFKLPFLGEWYISQGNEGNLTHKDKWKYAYDFIVIDFKGLHYKGTGLKVEDYYCYNKLVLAPADGTVENIIDDVEDNEIGNVNTEDNWGNSIVIKHSEYLYSQVSHLKRGSIQVTPGDKVKTGQLIANVGNSGRSPEPHLHFQVQAEPKVGSFTLEYPFGNYLLVKDNKGESKNSLKSYSQPLEKEIINNFESLKLLKNVFVFPPGTIIRYEYKGFMNGQIELESVTDVYNISYFLNKKTGAKAYFSVENDSFYFYDYIGRKSDILYYVFLSLYRIPLGYQYDSKISDKIRIDLIHNKFGMILQDFIAPFYVYKKANFNINFREIDNPIVPAEIIIDTSVNTGKKEILKSEIVITPGKVENIKINFKNKKTELHWIE